MNRKQFIAKLKKELNILFNPVIKITVTQKDNTIELGFWRDLEVLAIYTIRNIQYNEEYLQHIIEKVKIIHDGYLLGRIVERKIMWEELSLQIQHEENLNLCKKED